MYALVKTTYKVEVVRDDDGKLTVVRKRQKDSVIETYEYYSTADEAAKGLPSSAEIEYTVAEVVDSEEEDEDE